MMNKSTVDPNGNYADYLAGTVELNKASFTEAELKTLTDDIDAIRKIEEQIAEIENKTTSDSSKKNNTEATSPFSNLSGMLFLKARVQNTATFRLTLPQMQVNMPLILWHFPQLY